VLVLLPPSEGKAAGGNGPPLDLAGLSFPSLTPARERVVAAVGRAAREHRDAFRAALGLRASQEHHLDDDAGLTSSPTLPALERYTGVVYDQLGYATLRGPARRRANASLVVASALLGLVRPLDRVPAYRLSGGTSVPGLGGLPGVWRPALEAELAAQRGPVVDLRSGAYVALGAAPDAVQVRVLRETGGRRTVVSHDNKWTKGRLARALCEHGARSLHDVAEVARTCADDVEVDGRRLDLVLRGLASARA
jgi:cytoplasmic iron level regulating protein YaaA (DUF328/UPF0246 family)